MPGDRIQLGHAVLTRVLELTIEMRTGLFADTPPQAWAEHADLLAPTFVALDRQLWRIAMQSWVIHVDGLTVVVDTGVGNGRERPHMPPLDHLDTDYLAALGRAGVHPETVDVVINTHLHTDHVGWNTRRRGDAWVPTFPNARYLMPEADYRFFSPDGPGVNDGMRLVFSDSVIPVQEQIVLWSGEYQVSPSLTLRPAPGHTPGSSVVWLDAGVRAAFVGDLTHCPIQIVRPDDPCAFDVDVAAATRSRSAVFTDAARLGAYLVPAHYPGHGGALLRADGETFAVDRWLGLEAI
ncbi:MBL fold metallo-hydrolase [Mycolicibacterium komossense]|uniref:MBL fold metallo-hydrolase n=1 Tax=Mycolicibacterium komossense TaxID=1779 RepID=A0ABT3C9L5_9MYCO|nr:MBL fold metallo-hydrolase [Mycolicibacterium komossense]MCV7226128.1 MBL fold metallo-hydrolase [Mycolicibacterium komossense]